MHSRICVTYRIDKIIPFLKLLCKLAVTLDGTFVLTTLKAVVLDNRSDLRLELTTDMRPSRSDLRN
jgi:hypothetical protein